MQLDSEELVRQFQADWPDQYERSALRLLVAKLTEENEHLRVELGATADARPSTYTGTPGSFGLNDDVDGRHA